mmetsp:Transcript_13063/g.33061  ORF Transcript_13063/g.33061 Transcript_13063/m.33061 type:complete len:184 (-) Transcript_13063:269-820(-)
MAQLGAPDDEALEVGAENRLGEVFGNAQVITNTDVAEVLQSYENTMKEQDPTFEPNQVFKLTKEYVDRFKSFKTPASIEEFQRWALFTQGALCPGPALIHDTGEPHMPGGWVRLMSGSTVARHRNLIEVHGLTEFEKGLLINLAPEEIDEAKILIPSLDDEARFPDDVLSRILTELVTYKNFQ